jgi:hypothetical protein
LLGQFAGGGGRVSMYTDALQLALQTVQVQAPLGQEVSKTLLPSSQASGPLVTQSPQ